MTVTLGVLKETTPGENRVALIPEVATKFKAAGGRVLIERGAGVTAQFPDSVFKGAEFVDSAQAVLSQADVLLTVQPPTIEAVGALKDGAVVVGFMQAHARADLVKVLRDRKITS